MSVKAALGKAGRRGAAGQPAPSPDPQADHNGTRMVPFAEIVEDPDFTVRAVKAHPEQIATILQGLRNGVEVEPPVLWQCPEDGRFRVLDGWQRLLAFRQWKGEQAVPVVVRKCSRTAAILEAVRLRATTGTVPFSKPERMNVAWRLVRTPAPPGSNTGYAFSTSETAGGSGVSARQVQKMRRRAEAMAETGKAATGDWWRDKQDDREPAAEMSGEDRAAFVAEVAAAFGDALGRFRGRDDVALMEGIEAGMGRRLTSAFLDYIGSGEDEAFEQGWEGDDPTAPDYGF